MQETILTSMDSVRLQPPEIELSRHADPLRSLRRRRYASYVSASTGMIIVVIAVHVICSVFPPRLFMRIRIGVGVFGEPT